jgi:hypothetical protein
MSTESSSPALPLPPTMSSAHPASSTAGIDAPPTPTTSCAASDLPTAPLTSTAVPPPTDVSLNAGSDNAPAEGKAKKKKKKKRSRGSSEGNNVDQANGDNTVDAFTAAPNPPSAAPKVGREPDWDPRVMAILIEYLEEYIANRSEGKNTPALNGEVNARIADRLGPMCGFNLANLKAKIPGPAPGTIIRNNKLPMVHIPLCKVAAADYEWEVTARNKFRKDCRKVRRAPYRLRL